jgi:hypothetical protein
MLSPATARLLARCNGFDVTAEGDVIGTVATPVFSGTNLLPDFLLVRVAAPIPGVFRAFTTDQIDDIDALSGNVELGLTVREVASSPEPDAAGAVPVQQPHLHGAGSGGPQQECRA